MMIFSYAVVRPFGRSSLKSLGVLSADDAEQAIARAKKAFLVEWGGTAPEGLDVTVKLIQPETVRQIAIDAGVMSI